MPGRSIFIYGDRGVGKTSLAQTVAFGHQTGDRDPIFVACSSDSTFSALMKSIIELIVRPARTTTNTQHKFEVSIPGAVRYTHERHKNAVDPPDFSALDLNAAVDLLVELDHEDYSQVVVIDEFDRLTVSV